MSITEFSLSYQKSPIIFTHGIAEQLNGAILPIISITQAADYDIGPTGTVTGVDESFLLTDFLFDFYPMPGATLAENQIGAYPFANQSIAANSIIAQPLRVSLLMLAPVRVVGGYQKRLSVFQTLKAAVDLHTSLGGTYTIATPSYLYTNCILLNLRDVSSGDEKRPQDRWQWDFIQPLLTTEAAQAAQNQLMAKITSGVAVTPNASGEISPSGVAPAVGSTASSQGPSAVPAARPLTGASVSSPTGSTRPSAGRAGL
jgi:hypothetical protein